MNFVRSFRVPTLVLGGGGYTVRNVSRCWTYETSIVLGKEVKNELPFTDYLDRTIRCRSRRGGFGDDG